MNASSQQLRFKKLRTVSNFDQTNHGCQPDDHFVAFMAPGKEVYVKAGSRTSSQGSRASRTGGATAQGSR
jgi:hypothetical protein